MGTVAIWRETI